MKKMITTLLLASMLLSLAACGGTKETDTGTDTTADTTVQGESETETEKADPLAGLDVIDMEGYTFRQLIRNDDLYVADMIAEEQTGELVNDAVYRRNMEVEERYNCNFTYTRSSDANSDMDAKPGIIAGDDAFDWLVAHGRAAASYANGRTGDESGFSAVHGSDEIVVGSGRGREFPDAGRHFLDHGRHQLSVGERGVLYVLQ